MLIKRWHASSNHVQMQGLIFENLYFVSVAAEYKNGISAYSEQQKLYTAPRITCEYLKKKKNVNIYIYMYNNNNNNNNNNTTTNNNNNNNNNNK